MCGDKFNFMCGCNYNHSILTNKLTNRIGVPAVLVFMAIGMIFGSEGIFKIPFDNFGIAEKNLFYGTCLYYVLWWFWNKFKSGKAGS